MFSRERAARIAAEAIAAEANKRADEERKRADAERKRVDEERNRVDAERKRADQLVVQFTETQQAMLSAIAALTVEVSELRRQRTNGADGR